MLVEEEHRPSTNVSEPMAQIVRASASGRCCAERNGIEPRPTRGSLSQTFTFFWKWINTEWVRSLILFSSPPHRWLALVNGKKKEKGYSFYFNKNNLRFIFYRSVEKHRFYKSCLSLLFLLTVVYTSRNCMVRQFWPTCFNYNTIKTKDLTRQQPVKLTITSISRVGKWLPLDRVRFQEKGSKKVIDVSQSKLVDLNA